jgi:hypothetical protein
VTDDPQPLSGPRRSRTRELPRPAIPDEPPSPCSPGASRYAAAATDAGDSLGEVAMDL